MKQLIPDPGADCNNPSHSPLTFSKSPVTGVQWPGGGRADHLGPLVKAAWLESQNKDQITVFVPLLGTCKHEHVRIMKKNTKTESIASQMSYLLFPNSTWTSWTISRQWEPEQVKFLIALFWHKWLLVTSQPDTARTRNSHLFLENVGNRTTRGDKKKQIGSAKNARMWFLLRLRLIIIVIKKSLSGDFSSNFFLLFYRWLMSVYCCWCLHYTQTRTPGSYLSNTWNYSFWPPNVPACVSDITR